MGEGPALCGWSHPWQVVLRYIAKQTEQVMGRMSVSSVPPRPLFWFLPPGFHLSSCPGFLLMVQNEPFPFNVGFGDGFIIIIEAQLRQGFLPILGLLLPKLGLPGVLSALDQERPL